MNTNYRSVPAVINFINDVMGQMMTEDAGGVSYTGGQRLAAGSAGDGCVDIVLAGRYSEWEYYNSDHAFIAGKNAAEKVKNSVSRRGAGA